MYRKKQSSPGEESYRPFHPASLVLPHVQARAAGEYHLEQTNLEANQRTAVVLETTLKVCRLNLPVLNAWRQKEAVHHRTRDETPSHW